MKKRPIYGASWFPTDSMTHGQLLLALGLAIAVFLAGLFALAWGICKLLT